MAAFESFGKTIDKKLNTLTQEIKKKRTEEKELLDELSELFAELGEKVYEAEKGNWKSAYYPLIIGIESKKEEIEALKKKNMADEQSSTCPSCGNAISAEALFCPSCGNKIIKNKTERICPNCGQKANSTDKFCGACGTILSQIIEGNEEEIKVCPTCGSVCNSGEQYCENCGSAV